MRLQNGILNNINQTYIFGGDNDASMILTVGNLLEYTFVLKFVMEVMKVFVMQVIGYIF